jgi:hypothetical protein
MYFHNIVGTGSYTTCTANMYKKDRFHVPSMVTRGNAATGPWPLLVRPRREELAVRGGEDTWLFKRPPLLVVVAVLLLLLLWWGGRVLRALRWGLLASANI